MCDPWSLLVVAPSLTIASYTCTQLPLPGHLVPGPVIEEISPHKDVDGLHPYNTGKLCQV